METPTDQIETLFKHGGEYIKNRFDLWKLKAIDKTASAVSSIVEKIIIFFIAIIFFILINIALALLIGYWLGNGFYGFFHHGWFLWNRRFNRSRFPR